MTYDPAGGSAAELLARLLPTDAALTASEARDIEHALTGVLQTVPFDSKRQDQDRKTVSVLLRRLYSTGKYAPLLALMEHIDPALWGGNSEILRIQALEARGETEAVMAALKAPRPNEGDPHTSLAIMRMRKRYRIGFGAGDAETLFGSMRAPIETVLASIPLARWRTEPARRAARIFHDLSGRPPADAAAYEDDFVWGIAVRSLCEVLTSKNLDRVLMRRRRELLARVGRLDDSSLTPEGPPQHSIMMTMAHAGPCNPLNSLLYKPSVKLGDLLIANNADTAKSTDTAVRFGTREISNAGFLGVVKAVRKTPYRIRIFPDGQAGRDRQVFQLLGRDVSLGLGAAALAWHGRARTSFAGTRWVDRSRIETYLVHGPYAADFADRDAFEDAFHRFYLNALETIATGPAEDIGTYQGGVWNDFILPERAKLRQAIQD